jgi:hypothetical protein
MSFVLQSERVVSWPVKVQMPVDGGTFEAAEFTMRFRLLSIEPGTVFDDAFVRGAIVGWSDVHTEAGENLQFSAEALNQLLKIAYVRSAVTRAFAEAQFGAKAKN